MEEADLIKYCLFPLGPEGFVIKDLEELKSLCSVYSTELHTLSDGYIWNHDSFNISVEERSQDNEIEGKYHCSMIE